jgi:hypothetical protein
MRDFLVLAEHEVLPPNQADARRRARMIAKDRALVALSTITRLPAWNSWKARLPPRFCRNPATLLYKCIKSIRGQRLAVTRMPRSFRLSPGDPRATWQVPTTSRPEIHVELRRQSCPGA